MSLYRRISRRTQNLRLSGVTEHPPPFEVVETRDNGADILLLYSQIQYYKILVIYSITYISRTVRGTCEFAVVKIMDGKSEGPDERSLGKGGSQRVCRSRSPTTKPHTLHP